MNVNGVIICSECGRVIIPGNDENGIPNGVGFVCGGEIVNVCADCIIEAGLEKARREGRND